MEGAYAEDDDVGRAIGQALRPFLLLTWAMSGRIPRGFVLNCVPLWQKHVCKVLEAMGPHLVLPMLFLYVLEVLHGAWGFVGGRPLPHVPCLLPASRAMPDQPRAHMARSNMNLAGPAAPMPSQLQACMFRTMISRMRLVNVGTCRTSCFTRLLLRGWHGGWF